MATFIIDAIPYVIIPGLLLWYLAYRLKQPVWRGFAGACVGAVIGGICGIVLPPLYLQLTNPEILNDGQWGLIYLATLPAGLVIGAVVGFCCSIVRAHNNKR